MIESELLHLLICPQDRTRLEPAPAELVDQVNQAIVAGKVKNQGGQEVSQPIEAGLVREDRAVLYPIFDGIPALLVDEAILIQDIEGGHHD